MVEGRRGIAGEGKEDDWPHKEVTETIIAAAIKVQRALGPGLLESTYDACLAHWPLKDDGIKRVSNSRWFSAQLCELIFQ
jgi:hypothetical protein